MIARRVTPSADEGELGSCDLAIEAVPEIMDVKREIFRRLDAALPPAALIASNTSGLSITALGRETGRPHRVLGLHFFNPASVMRLVECVRGADTGDEALAAGEAFARALGKTPVRVRECPGFLVNRVLVRALAGTYRHAAATGADGAAADQAVVAEGPAPMGPFALGDLIGLDTLEHIRAHLEQAYGERFGDGARSLARWPPGAWAASREPGSTTATRRRRRPTSPAGRAPSATTWARWTRPAAAAPRGSPHPATSTWSCATAAGGAGALAWARSASTPSPWGH